MQCFQVLCSPMIVLILLMRFSGLVFLLPLNGAATWTFCPMMMVSRNRAGPKTGDSCVKLPRASVPICYADKCKTWGSCATPHLGVRIFSHQWFHQWTWSSSTSGDLRYSHDHVCPTCGGLDSASFDTYDLACAAWPWLFSQALSQHEIHVSMFCQKDSLSHMMYQARIGRVQLPQSSTQVSFANSVGNDLSVVFCCHCHIPGQPCVSEYSPPHLRTWPHCHACQCVLWLPRLHLDLDGHKMHASVLSSSCSVFTVQELAAGLGEWRMMRRSAVCLDCLLPSCTSACSAVQIFAVVCIPLPVFHLRDRGSWSCVTWGECLVNDSDISSYHVSAQCSHSRRYPFVGLVLAMPQPGTPLQYCVLSSGWGRTTLQPTGSGPCTEAAQSTPPGDVSDSLEARTPDHSYEGAGHIDPAISAHGATAGVIPYDLELLLGGGIDATGAVTALNPVAGGGRRLGLYARISLRLTSRLPVMAPRPSMLATLSYEVPRPTIALRLRPKTRAVAKMLVRSRLRCQCCFHRLGFCMREKAESLFWVLSDGHCVFMRRPCTMTHVLVMIWQAWRGLEAMMEVCSSGALSSDLLQGEVVRLSAVRTGIGVYGQPAGKQTPAPQVGPVARLLRSRAGGSSDICDDAFRRSLCSLVRVDRCLLCCLLGTYAFTLCTHPGEGSGITSLLSFFCSTLAPACHDLSVCSLLACSMGTLSCDGGPRILVTVVRPIFCSPDLSYTAQLSGSAWHVLGPCPSGRGISDCHSVYGVYLSVTQHLRVSSCVTCFITKGLWTSVPGAWSLSDCLAVSLLRGLSSMCADLDCLGPYLSVSGTSHCSLACLACLIGAPWESSVVLSHAQVMPDSASAVGDFDASAMTQLERMMFYALRARTTRWERPPGTTFCQGSISSGGVVSQCIRCRSSRQPLSMVLDFKHCSQYIGARLAGNDQHVCLVKGRLISGRPRRQILIEWSFGGAHWTALLAPRPSHANQVHHPSWSWTLMPWTNGWWCATPPPGWHLRRSVQRGLLSLALERLLTDDHIRVDACLCSLQVGGRWHACTTGGNVLPNSNIHMWVQWQVKLAEVANCSFRRYLHCLLHGISRSHYEIMSLPGPKSGGDTMRCWTHCLCVGLLAHLHLRLETCVADVRVGERAGLSSEAVERFFVWLPNAKPAGRGAVEPIRLEWRCCTTYGRPLTHNFIACLYLNFVLTCHTSKAPALCSDALGPLNHCRSYEHAFCTSEHLVSDPLDFINHFADCLSSVLLFAHSPLPDTCGYTVGLSCGLDRRLYHAFQAGLGTCTMPAVSNSRVRLWRRWRLRSPVRKAQIARHKKCTWSLFHVRARLRRILWLDGRSLCSNMSRVLRHFLRPQCSNPSITDGCHDVSRSYIPKPRSHGLVQPFPVPASSLRRLLFTALVGTRLVGVTSIPTAGEGGGHALPCEPGKKSYARACQRAFRDGATTYRGRPLYRNQVPPTMLQAIPRRVSERRSHARPEYASSARLKIFCWNCSGLTHCQDQLFHWLTVNSYDIVILQETLWKFTNTWATSNYVFIHSGVPKSGRPEGGLLVMIAKRLVREQDVRYIDVIPGRILRVHTALLGTAGQSLDVVAAYQHTWNPSADTLGKRSVVWSKLSEVLHSVSGRSCLVMGGDFNVTCRPLGRHVGHGVPRRPHSATDFSDFMAVLEAHQLTALNTHKKAPSYTFRFGDRCSQLDYICTRLKHADAHARQAMALDDFPIGEHTSSEAARHFPVVTSISCRWPYVTRQQNSSHQQLDLARLAMDVQNDSIRLAPIRTEIANWVDNAPTHCQDGTLVSLDESLARVGAVQYGKHQCPRTSHWQDEIQVFRAQTMWGLFRKMRAQSGTLRGLFVAWRCWGRFQHMHKQYAMHSMNLRKEKRLRTLSDVRQAADKHDTWGLYKIIRSIAPKCPAKKFQIRKDGHLLGPSEELQVVIDHYNSLYKDGDMRRISRSLPTPVSVTVNEVWHALMHIPLRKAVSSNSAAGALYRSCADVLAPKVCQWLLNLWQAEKLSVPTRWSSAQLIFLHKPGKSTVEVKDWRPIGLQCPLGKAVMHVLVRRMKPYVTAWAEQFPMHAYVAGRCTTTALSVVFQHCMEVRSLCLDNQDTLRRRYEGWRPQELVGGLQVCLDLSSAFDKVPWRHIDTALEMAHVPDELRHVLMNWLEASRYEVSIAAEAGAIAVERGVKQGCRASPLLFLAYMCLVSSRIDTRLRPGWSAEHMTVYADDTHVRWCIRSPQDLAQATKELGALMQTLEDMGMTLNNSKAQALLTLKGLKRQMCRRKWTIKKKNQLHLSFEFNGQLREVPIVASAEYLGAIISYDHFESRTVAHRIQKASVRYWQLQKILTSKQGLNVRQRLQMWEATIRSCLLYGIDCLPLTPALRHELNKFAMRHVRAITANQSHLTHTSDQELLQMFDMSSLDDCLNRAITRVAQALRTVPFASVDQWGDVCRQAFAAARSNLAALDRRFDPHACPVCGVYFDSRRAVKVHIVRAHASSMDSTSLPASAVVPCAVFEPASGMGADCPPGFHVQSASSSVRISTAAPAAGDDPPFCLSIQRSSRPDDDDTSRHVTMSHDRDPTKAVVGVSPAEAPERAIVVADVPVPTDHKVFDKAIHSRDGLPTCAACGENFSRWAGLRKHIVKGYCAVLHSVAPTAPPVVVQDFVPIVLRSAVQEVILRRGVSGMLNLPNIMTEMQQRCVLCHQWVASSWMMKNHFRNSHSAFWKDHHATCATYCKQHGECALTCRYCQKPSKARGDALAHMKRCTVLWQIAVIHCYLKHGRHSGCTSAAGRVLRQGSDRVSPQTTQDRGGPDPASSQQGRRLRQGTKGPPKGYYRQFDRRQLGVDTVHLQGSCPARGQCPSSSAGQCLGVVLENRSANDCSSVISSGGSLASRSQQTCSRPGGSQAFARDSLFDDTATPCPKRQKLQGGLGSPADLQDPGMGYTGRTVAISEVVSGLQDVEGRCVKDSAGHGCHSSDSFRDDGGSCCDPGVAQIPRHSQDHLRDDGHRHYGHGRGNEAYSRGADLPSFGDSTGLCRLAVARGSIQERIPEEIPSGGQNPASGLWQRVMTATYVNRSSHCYANSWVRALLAASWHCYQDFRVAGLFLPCLLQAHHAPAHARAHVQILDSEFLRLLQNWPRPHVQNDVFEFAYTFMESAGVTQAFGKWEHRVLHEGQLRLRDSGRIVSFYIQGHATQSQLWMQWQAQGGHAFLEPPPIILAQVMRFQPDASGRLRRRTGMITNWRSEVSVPVFCSSADTNVRYCTYKPVAVIMHSGHVPTSGHYTCAVICSEHILFFDDNLSPRSIPDFNAEHMRLIYGILYTAVF